MNIQTDTLEALRRSLVVAFGRPPYDDEFVTAMLVNRLPLLSFDKIARPPSEEGGSPNVAQPGALNSHAFTVALHEESDQYERVHGHFVRLAQAWKAEGMDWICFKSAGIDPAFPYTSDNYDILVSSENSGRAREALLDLGYVELRNIEEPQKWLFRLFAGGESVSAIHLHTRVGWGQGFMIEPEIWRRRRLAPDNPWTWVPGPEDSILINVAHAVFENKELTLHDVMKVRYAISMGVDWEYMDFVASQRGWTKGLHVGLAVIARLEKQLFEEASISEERQRRFLRTIEASRMLRRFWRDLGSRPPVVPHRLSFVMSKLLYFDKIYADKHVPVTEKPVLTTLSLVRGFKGQLGAHPQNSALVTISGMDGSGKTAQALALADVFAIAELRAEVRWARFGATPVVYSISRAIRNRRGRRMKRSNELESADDKPFSRKGLPLQLWAGLSAADYCVWLLHVRWRLLHGEIVIADRYLCDVDVELRQRLAEHPHLNGWIMSTLSCVAPRPQSAYLLRIDPHLAAERAVPDGGDIAMPEQMLLYDSLKDRHNLAVLDGAAPFELASAQLARGALRRYMKRYGTTGNLIYFSNPWQLNRTDERAHRAQPVARSAYALTR